MSTTKNVALKKSSERFILVEHVAWSGLTSECDRIRGNVLALGSLFRVGEAAAALTLLVLGGLIAFPTLARTLSIHLAREQGGFFRDAELVVAALFWLLQVFLLVAPDQLSRMGRVSSSWEPRMPRFQLYVWMPLLLALVDTLNTRKLWLSQLLSSLVSVYILTVTLSFVITGAIAIILSYFLTQGLLLVFISSKRPSRNTNKEPRFAARIPTHADFLRTVVVSSGSSSCFEKWARADWQHALRIAEQRTTDLETQAQVSSFLLATAAFLGLAPSVSPELFRDLIAALSQLLSRFAPVPVEAFFLGGIVLVVIVVVIAYRYFLRTYEASRTLEIVKLLCHEMLAASDHTDAVGQAQATDRRQVPDQPRLGDGRWATGRRRDQLYKSLQVLGAGVMLGLLYHRGRNRPWQQDRM